MFRFRLSALHLPLFLGIAFCSWARHDRSTWGAADVESHAGARPAAAGLPEAGWRRTADGWEEVANWSTTSDGQRPTQAARIHPGLVAALILLVSLAALLAFDPLVESYRNFRGGELNRLLLQQWAHRVRRRAESRPHSPNSL